MARTKEMMNGENSEKDENSCTDTENGPHHLLLPAALQIVRRAIVLIETGIPNEMLSSLVRYIQSSPKESH